MPYADPEKRKAAARRSAIKVYWDNPAKARAARRNTKLVCENCGVDFLGRPGARCCTRSCSAKLAHKEGRLNTIQPRQHPTGRREHVGRDGTTYIQVWKPVGYPGRPKNGWMMEHRVVMQESLGRPLERWEKVHHRNSNTTDNRRRNLKLVTAATHSGLVQCPHCRQKFHLH